MIAIVILAAYQLDHVTTKPRYLLLLHSVYVGYWRGDAILFGREPGLGLEIALMFSFCRRCMS